MRTKLEIRILHTGFTVGKIANVIGAHNGGITLILLKEISSILKYEAIEYPYKLKALRLELIEDEGKLNVYEDGETLTYSIQETKHFTLNENEFYTLDMCDPNNKEKQIAGEDALLFNPIYQINKNK